MDWLGWPLGVLLVVLAYLLGRPNRDRPRAHPGCTPASKRPGSSGAPTREPPGRRTKVTPTVRDT